jgi:DNA repair protein RadC
MKQTAQTESGVDGYVDRADEGPLLCHLVRPYFASDVERLLIFGFDEQNRLVGMTESKAAHVRHAILAPAMVREAFSFADAATFLLVHNHPSDDCSPSRSDIDLTQRLAGVASLMGLTLSDHVILASNGHYSFHAAGLL